MLTYFENLPLEVLHPLFLFSELKDYSTVANVISRLRECEKWSNIFNEFARLKIYPRAVNTNLNRLIYSIGSGYLFRDIKLLKDKTQIDSNYFINQALIDRDERLFFYLEDIYDVDRNDIAKRAINDAKFDVFNLLKYHINYDSLIISALMNEDEDLFFRLREYVDDKIMHHYDYDYLIYRALIKDDNDMFLLLKKVIDDDDVYSFHTLFFKKYSKRKVDFSTINLKFFMSLWSCVSVYEVDDEIFNRFIYDLLTHPKIYWGNPLDSVWSDLRDLDRDLEEDDTTYPSMVRTYAQFIISRKYSNRMGDRCKIHCDDYCDNWEQCENFRKNIEDINEWLRYTKFRLCYSGKCVMIHPRD